LYQPGITAPIVGASQMSHREESIAALGIALPEEDRRYLEEPYRPHPVLGHD